MVDLNNELRSTLLDSGVTISADLANRIIEWGIGYLEDNTGVPLRGRDEITEAEQAQIEAWFQDPDNALAYGMAFMQQPFYQEYLEALQNIEIPDVDPPAEEPGTETPPDTDPTPDPAPPLDIDSVQEWVEAVARLYAGLLETTPSDQLIELWRAQYDTAVALTEKALTFLGQAGLPDPDSDPDAFFQQLYLDVLGREADADGLAYWTGLLEQGRALSDLLIEFTSSEEARDALQSLLESALQGVDYTQPAGNGLSDEASVDSIYQAILGRDPDDEGRDYWLEQLAAQEDPDDLSPLIESFLTSDEFQQANADLADADYLAMLYLQVLGRVADAGGLAYWQGVLEEGGDRAEVAEAFIESDEYLILLAGTTAEGDVTIA
ncbi:DUF4214 domain-containing protein [Halomonas sp.]|uniref:DUF4214 domain-containing protein n=1 Tax=Halomonas sp. TaxID=1486246 RepID=UPI003D13799B